MSSIFTNAEWRLGTPGGEDYYAAPALSQSLLKYVNEPEYFLALWRGLEKGKPLPIKASASMLEGSMLDDLLFNPDAAWEAQDGRKSATKPADVNWLPGSPSGAFAGVNKAAAAIRNHNAYELVKRADCNMHQVEIYATHTATGLLVKGRLDTLAWWAAERPDSFPIVDVKKTVDIGRGKFRRQCEDLGRYVQSAKYLNLAAAVAEKDPNWAKVKDFLAVAVELPELEEIQPPVRVYRLMRTDYPLEPEQQTDESWAQFERERECYEAYERGTLYLDGLIRKAADLIECGLPQSTYCIDPLPPSKFAFEDY